MNIYLGNYINMKIAMERMTEGIQMTANQDNYHVSYDNYCASCGNLIDKGSRNYELKGILIDGVRMPWPVCKRCWTKHYDGYLSSRK